MNVLLELQERARRKNARIVLPEAGDERVVRAAARLADEGLVQPVLVRARGMGSVPSSVEVVDPGRDPRADSFAEALHERRKAKGMTPAEARERMLDPLMFGAAPWPAVTSPVAWQARGRPPTSCVPPRSSACRRA